MIDVVTVCAGKDLENITTCIVALKKNLDINNIYVITNDISRVPDLDSVIAINENDIISYEQIERLKKIDFPYSNHRFGWYFQQFLKMEFARSIYCQGDYLIWDADTILLKKINFHENESVLFTKGEEQLNNHYVSTYQKLLGVKKTFSFSLISQHLFVNRAIMLRMLDEIENRHKDNFCEAILSNIDGDSPSLFSEYETYVNYYAQINPCYRVIERKWFRHAAAICGFGSGLNVISKKFPDCDYVAMEKFDITFKGKLKGIIKYLHYKLKNYF
ncbi:DUF6492 family protein [Xenorhabdus szentirmaii]|uniref:DUF6492 family protein n=1 Tax=Xenorhabdus szentirmaii TaxID=290112 RepID=UPI0032B82557